MPATTNAFDLFRRIGADHRAIYRNEFGADPVRDQVGDWDSAGWATAWDEREIGFDSADQDYYNAARAAYLDALFGDQGDD